MCRPFHRIHWPQKSNDLIEIWEKSKFGVEKCAGTLILSLAFPWIGVILLAFEFINLFTITAMQQWGGLEFELNCCHQCCWGFDLIQRYLHSICCNFRYVALLLSKLILSNSKALHNPSFQRKKRPFSMLLPSTNEVVWWRHEIALHW